MFYNLRISRLCVMSLAQFHQPSRYSEMRRLQAETSPGGRVGEPFEGHSFLGSKLGACDETELEES
jgi:hypothetical protein